MKYSPISAGQNTNISYELWINGLVLRVQVYQTKDPRFKTIGWLKNCHNLSSFKVQSNEHQKFLGNWLLKVSLHRDSAARQLNSIHKVVHWDKWSIKRGQRFFVKCTYLKDTSEVRFRKYALISILQVYIKMLI